MDSNRGPSACQPNALPLGQTGSRLRWGRGKGGGGGGEWGGGRGEGVGEREAGMHTLFKPCTKSGGTQCIEWVLG